MTTLEYGRTADPINRDGRPFMKKTIVFALAFVMLTGIFAAPSAYALDEPWEQSGTLPQQVHVAQPVDTACGPAGTLYVADMFYNRIKRYTPHGVLDTGWGGDGIVGGIQGSGPNDFKYISDIAVDSGGSVYVAETGNDRVKRYTPDGVLDLSWGSGDGIIGGNGSGPEDFNDPMGLALDSSGNLYVADRANGRVVRYTSAGLRDTTWGGGDGIIALSSPMGVGCDASDNLYVANWQGVWRYTSDPTSDDGTLDLTFGGGDGIIDGSGGAGDNQEFYAIDIVVTPSGLLYVMDGQAARSRVLRYDEAGMLDTAWGGGDAIIGGQGLGAGQFHSVHGGSVDSRGNLYVADAYGWSVERYTDTGDLDTSWCGDGVMGTFGNEPDQFRYPFGAAADANGNVYVADSQNHRVVRYTPSGDLDTSWGGGDGIIGNMQGSGVDQFDFPQDVAVDGQNRLYILDAGNHRIVRYTSSGVLDTSWATGGIILETDGSGSAQNKSIIGITVSPSGCIYVSDSVLHRIKRYTPSGSLDTSWASGGILSGLNGPRGLATDASGNLYIADSDNHRVLRYTSAGLIDTSWGGGDGIVGGMMGSGIDQLSTPQDVVVNPSTNALYIADLGNRRTMRYDADGASPELVWPYTNSPETQDAFGIYVTGLVFWQGSLYAVCNFQNYVHVLYDVEAGLKLSGITVGGNPVSSFNPDTLTCSVIVPQSATEITIGADTVYTTSSVSGTGTFSLPGGSSDFALTVTAQNGDTQDYTLSVLRDGSDVGLSMLTVDGQAVSGFSESDTSYTVTAPYGARYVDIGATGNRFASSVTGTGVMKLTDASTTFNVIAKANDGSAKEYTLTVKKGSAPSIWAKLFTDGTQLDADVFRISVPPDGKSVILTVQLSNGSEKTYELALSQAYGSGEDNPPDENIPDTGDRSTGDTSPNESAADTAQGISDDITSSAADVGADTTNDKSASPVSPVFPWWWILVGVLGAGTIGFGSWVLLLKRRA